MIIKIKKLDVVKCSANTNDFHLGRYSYESQDLRSAFVQMYNSVRFLADDTYDKNGFANCNPIDLDNQRYCPCRISLERFQQAAAMIGAEVEILSESESK